MRRGSWLVLGVVALTGLTGGGALLITEWLPDGRALPGTTVGGYLQPDDRSLGEWLEARRTRLLEREAYLLLPDETIVVTLGQLGVELDVAETMRSVQEHARSGRVDQRLWRAWRARRGWEKLPLSWSFDANRARSTLEELAPSVYRSPVDARLDLRAHRRVDDVPGRKLDVSGTLKAIAGGERELSPAFVVATADVPAGVTTEMLAKVDVSRVLGSFETSFRGKAGARAVNIAQAAEYLDGTVIGPGKTLSFNETVGPRTLQRGFTYAPVIVNDELEAGVGGGVCQVATTLHGAAVFGMLEVVRRRSHSRASGYAPLGLDATVVDGEVDLRLKNPFDSPVIVHAFLPDKYTLRVELLGRDAPAKVEHDYAVVKTHDYYRRVTTKQNLEPGAKRRRQRGKPGYDVISVVTITHPDGRVEKRTYPSKYYPVPEVYWVGPGYDLNELPPLPERAKKVEVDGVEVSSMGDVAAIENPYQPEG